MASFGLAAKRGNDREWRKGRDAIIKSFVIKVEED